MKAFVSFSVALAVVAVAGAQTTAPAKPPVKIDLGSSSPKTDTKNSAKEVPKADAKKKKEEPPGRIEGLAIARGDGFLGLQLVDNKFKLTFYNAKKKPVPPDVASAVLRWNVNYQPGPERTQLTPGGDANSLTSAKIVRGPFIFKITILLLKGEGEEAGTESFLVDFRQ